MKTLNFSSEILEKDQINTYFSELYNSETNHHLVKGSLKPESNVFNNKLIVFHDVPGYFDTKLISSLKNIELKKINTYKGSLINILNYNTVEDYLNKEISSKERYEIRRRQKRLDACIKPIYKTYYGNISKEEYDIVFNDYKQMLIRRLEQKKSYWEELDYWEERYESTFQLIKEKKACIFVIYRNETPISIYINSVFDKIIFNEVVAYDIDYSKFNIGILIFIKIIEWAINNNFELIDMSKGDFSYKERFKNTTYTFQNHIIYDKSNFKISLVAKMLILKLNVIYTLLPWLKKLKLNKLKTFYNRIKNRHVFKDYNSLNELVLETEMLSTLDTVSNLKSINQNSNLPHFLKKPIIDFAFLNTEFVDEIDVFLDLNSDKKFYLKGKKAIQKIILH